MIFRDLSNNNIIIIPNVLCKATYMKKLYGIQYLFIHLEILFRKKNSIDIYIICIYIF